MTMTRVSDRDKKYYKDLIWENYAAKQATGEAPNQTKLFFDTIPPALEVTFRSSTKRILQLGVSSGEYLAGSGLAAKRECIGYDYTETGVAFAKLKGVNAKLVDLTEIDDSESLVCRQHLNADMSVPVDMLAIRVMEYLDPQTVVALIYSLIDAAKPGSTFYFETHLRNNSTLPEAVCRRIENSYIASFFGPRTDMSFNYHKINFETEGEKRNVTGTIDQFIVTKR